MQVADENPIDMETFSQILELDEDEAVRDFSTEMVWQYFTQAATTFDDLDNALYVPPCLLLSRALLSPTLSSLSLSRPTRSHAFLPRSQA